ncbi:arsenical pump-driving ATPase [Lachnospiraceae bacterium KM106-2]|nr:arsenical pump-driving ATPase [Lachnospiraceae bacterium KM106-2]
MGRIIVFTGKGGVGKTSVAAAHARKSALLGNKTILVSADMAHNLGDLFERPIGREIVKVADHLDALEVDPDYEMEHDFGEMMQAFEKMLPSMESGGEKENDGWGKMMFPGTEELFALLKIKQIYESEVYDTIIVDCAPTGETLSLLKFPELLSWYMEKLFPIGKVAVRMLRPVGKKLFQVELPNKAAMNDIERLYFELSRLQQLLKDHTITTIRLVTMPEKMVVEETKRSYMYLNLYGFQVDGLFINRVLPQEANETFFEEWFQIQNDYMNELEQVFLNIPIIKIKWYETDINGMESIDRLVTDIMKDDSVLDVKCVSGGDCYTMDGKNYLLTIQIPFADKKEVDLHEAKQDLIVKIGNYKRSIPLPDTLRGYEVAKAKLEDGKLVVTFELA